VFRSVALIAGLLLLPGAAGIAESGTNERPLEFRHVLSGSFSPFFFSGLPDRVIRNQQQWCRFWEAAHATLVDPPACDRSLVDFRREVVITTGVPGPDGCHGIEIDGIEARRGRQVVRVYANDIVPGMACICTQSVVYPVLAVAVRRTIGRVRFVHETVVLDCGPELDVQR
jgi:hypothetical protein